jgi:hypothetical protein
MAFLSLPRIRRLGNLPELCEAPSDHLHRMGEVWQLTWTSPVFQRLIQLDVPAKSRFLVRPRLLTCM